MEYQFLNPVNMEKSTTATKLLRSLLSSHKLRFFMRPISAATLLSLTSCGGTSAYNIKPATTQLGRTVSTLQYKTSPGNALSNNPFNTAAWNDELNRMDSNSKAFREFEHLYLAAENALGLKAQGNFSNSFVTPAASPASDYTLDTTVMTSNGKDLCLYVQVKRMDGVRVGQFQQTWSVEAGTAQNPIGFLPSVYSQIGSQVGAIIARDNVDLDYLRAQVYVGQKLPYNSRIVEIAREAASVEREQVLAPTSQRLTSTVSAIRPVYAKWQKSAYPFAMQREQAKNQMNSLNFQAGVGGMMAGQQIAQGNTSGGLQSFTDTMKDVLPEMVVAEAQMKSAEAVLISQKAALNMNGFGSVTITLFNKLHKLHGSLGDQLTQLRAIVKEEILKAVPSA